MENNYIYLNNFNFIILYICLLISSTQLYINLTMLLEKIMTK